MNIVLFEESEINKPLAYSDERAQHIIKILHKKEGETFSAGIIDGSTGHALIKKIELKESMSSNGKAFTEGFIHFEYVREADGMELNPLTMIIGFPRPIQLKRLLRDMAGLGVKEIHLCKTELGEKSYAESDLSAPESCRKLLIEGCIQAGVTIIPEVFFHESLKECLEKINAGTENGNTTFKAGFDNISPSVSISEFVHGGFPENSCAFAAIGSERGWTNAERNLLTQNGFKLVKLGNRILRTESAATVAASILLNGLGCY